MPHPTPFMQIAQSQVVLLPGLFGVIATLILTFVFRRFFGKPVVFEHVKSVSLCYLRYREPRIDKLPVHESRRQNPSLTRPPSKEPS